jgi:hypothetical protein
MTILGTKMHGRPLFSSRAKTQLHPLLQALLSCPYCGTKAELIFTQYGWLKEALQTSNSKNDTLVLKGKPRYIKTDDPDYEDY